MRVDLAACQVRITADDYASADAFERLLARIGARLDTARTAGAECLAVFPEMLGAFLPLAGRLGLVRGAKTTDGALLRVALRSLPSVARAMLRGRTLSPKVGFLLAAAPEVWRIYRGAFSRFAARHRAWVVAGTALLPRNRHGDLADVFAPADGRVYNTSYLFAPDGRHVGCTRKVNLVPTLEDVLGLSPGAPEDVRPVATPFGPVGTLICYDGFDQPHTRGEPRFCRLAARLDEAGCAVIAQPAANPWPWDERWCFAEPGETQLRREQWLREGLEAQLRADAPRLRHVRYAVNPQLIGRIFDNRFDGRSYLFAREPDGAVRVLGESASTDGEEVVVRTVDLALSLTRSGLVDGGARGGRSPPSN